MMNNNYEDMFDLKMSRLEDNMDKYPVMKKACIEIGKGINDYEKIINPDNFQDLKLNLEDEINILTAMNRSCGTNISSVEAYISSISTKPSMSELIDKLSSELAIDSNIDENMICSYIFIRYIMREYFPDMIGDIVISSSDTITTEDNNVSDGETTVWDKLDENSSDDSLEDITDISSRFESMFTSSFINGMKDCDDGNLSDDMMERIISSTLSLDDDDIKNITKCNETDINNVIDALDKITEKYNDVLSGKNTEEIINWLSRPVVAAFVGRKLNIDKNIISSIIRLITANADIIKDLSKDEKVTDEQPQPPIIDINKTEEKSKEQLQIEDIIKKDEEIIDGLLDSLNKIIHTPLHK